MVNPPPGTDGLDAPRPIEAPLSVLVVDDDPLVRSALRTVASEHADIVIVGEAIDGDDAVAQALHMRPDIVLLDVAIPGMDSTTVTRLIQAGAPEVRVVVFSSAEDAELAVAGLRSGAAGFLAKDVSSGALVRALRGLAKGEAAVSRSLTSKLLEHLRRSAGPSSGMRPVWSTLTSREWQVLDLLCDGASTDEVATALGLSVETVRSHLKHILAKLGAHTREEAVDAARRLRAGETLPPAGPPATPPVDEVARRRIVHGRRRRGSS